MRRKCADCGVGYDDEFRSTICPHNLFPANDGNNVFTVHHESELDYPDPLTNEDLTWLRRLFRDVYSLEWSSWYQIELIGDVPAGVLAWADTERVERIHDE